MSLITSLRQPFPYNPSIRSKLVMAAFFGIFVFLFLIVFQPFDLDFFPARQLAVIALGYGAITFVCVFVATALFPVCLPSSFNESAWTTGRQIIFTAGVICFVGLINYLVSPLLVNTRLDVNRLFWFQGITLAIALIPISIYILLRQNLLLKKFSQQAQAIEKKLQERQEQQNDITPSVEKKSPERFMFVGDYQNERLELFPDDLHVIAAAGNYIKLYHLQKEQLVYSIIRSTLKKAEETVLAEPNFFKCHRAYIINLDKVEHVEGNAQGYKVRMAGFDELIPVSRNLNTEFSDKLLAFRKQLA